MLFGDFLPSSSVNITFIDRDGEEHSVQAKIGDTLLEVAKQYDIDLEGVCVCVCVCACVCVCLHAQVCV